METSSQHSSDASTQTERFITYGSKRYHKRRKFYRRKKRQKYRMKRKYLRCFKISDDIVELYLVREPKNFHVNLVSSSTNFEVKRDDELNVCSQKCVPQTTIIPENLATPATPQITTLLNISCGLESKESDGKKIVDENPLVTLNPTDSFGDCKQQESWLSESQFAKLIHDVENTQHSVRHCALCILDCERDFSTIVRHIRTFVKFETDFLQIKKLFAVVSCLWCKSSDLVGQNAFKTVLFELFMEMDNWEVDEDDTKFIQTFAHEVSEFVGAEFLQFSNDVACDDSYVGFCQHVEEAEQNNALWMQQRYNDTCVNNIKTGLCDRDLYMQFCRVYIRIIYVLISLEKHGQAQGSS